MVGGSAREVARGRVESVCAALDDAQPLWKEYETYVEEDAAPGYVNDVVGEAMSLSPDVDEVSFNGCTLTAKRID